MQRKTNNKKSWPLKVGFFFLLVGIIIIISNPIMKLKEEVFEEMRLKISEKEEKDKITINNVDTNNLQITTEEQKEEEKNEPPKITYKYIGYLTINDINLKRGFVSKESKYNDINYNVTIAQEADYPDVANGNFILMAHSGNAYISFFENLYKLNIGAKATITYNNQTYNYELKTTYTQPKTGTVAIYRDNTKKTLTLITCTHQDDYNQSVYIFEAI